MAGLGGWFGLMVWFGLGWFGLVFLVLFGLVGSGCCEGET